MTERLLSVESDCDPISLRLGGQPVGFLFDEQAPAVAAELDRLYAAAEANQAPGPDWKAKLRGEVAKRVTSGPTGDYLSGWNQAMRRVLDFIDALPDPPTPDPDAPPVYVPPEGHYAPVLGRDVPDGWEGRRWPVSASWRDALSCRTKYPNAFFEVRRVPAPEPATEWVPLTKLVGRTIKGETKPVGRFLTAINDGCLILVSGVHTPRSGLAGMVLRRLCRCHRRDRGAGTSGRGGAVVRGDDPRWGCVEPGCDAHPANPRNGGPIYRLSPKGQPFVGACGKHYAKHDAPVAEGER